MGILLFAALAAGAAAAQVESADLAKFLPAEIDGWRPAAADELYTGDRIFEYIDGAGEVYRAYNYRSLLARRYARPGQPDIIADFFDMGVAADAFGVFTHGLEGARLDIGQGAVASEGQLSFWKDRYYISLYAETQTPEVRRALLGLGRVIAESIPGEGHRPGILALFPQGFDIRQARYFHRHVILNYHYFVASDNILFLDGRTEAALAASGDGVRKTYLLIVRYPSDEDAERARQSFEKSYLHTDAVRGAVEIKRGKWSAAVSRRAHLFIVFDAATREEARDILEKAAGKLAGLMIIAHPECVKRP
ncbi:MAG: hypothetical protein A2W03_16030 [Candidatus Aminicenantes bacterium RBG_16_63_16]|nr:MAG: hypothetical protein A2W03_16030 [Candidatus Aminicenantes bacterium RBG_16_63_16]